MDERSARSCGVGALAAIRDIGGEGQSPAACHGRRRGRV